MVVGLILVNVLLTVGCNVSGQQVSAILQMAGGLLQQVGQSGVLNQVGSSSSQTQTTGSTGSLVSSTGQGFNLPVSNDPQSQASSQAVQQASAVQLDTAADFEPVAAD